MPKLNKRARRRLIKTTLVFGNAALLVVVGTFVFTNRTASQTVRRSTSSSAIQTAASAQNPLDQLSSAEIAVQAAQLVGLDELTAVRNQADSENAQLSTVPNDSSIVAKPQIVGTSQRSKKNILSYTTVAGDTVSGLAAKFSVDANSIKFSNALTADAIDAGKVIVIPPGTGIVYTVKSGDTVASVATKFQADKNLFVTVNDAENGTLAVGDKVWIPGGVQPAVTTRYSGASYSGFAWGGFSALYGSNGYDYGYCTWYVANKRAAVGHPIPSNLGNASTWKVLAQRAGMPTGPTPRVGAVAWKVPYDYYGHVAYVEEVYADGSFKVTEMNTVGWGRVSTQVVPASSVGTYYFIY